MAAAITEENLSVSLQKGFSEWWNEETDNVFQRIERWAAFARGYNRLRSERLSRGRLTMCEKEETNWRIESKKIVIDDRGRWSPRFNDLKRSHIIRRKSRNNEENCKINCCVGFNYQSNGKTETNCLETYRYDHSIYFKTIGDIKSNKKDFNPSENENDDRFSFSDENIEWETPKTSSDFFEDRENDGSNEIKTTRNIIYNFETTDFTKNRQDEEKSKDEETRNFRHDFWPIVDITKLSIDVEDSKKMTIHDFLFDNENTTENIFASNDSNSDDDNNNNNSNNSNNNNSIYNYNNNDYCKEKL